MRKCWGYGFRVPAVGRPRNDGNRDFQPPVGHDPEKWTPVFGKDHAQTKTSATSLMNYVESDSSKSTRLQCKGRLQRANWRLKRCNKRAILKSCLAWRSTCAGPKARGCRGLVFRNPGRRLTRGAALTGPWHPGGNRGLRRMDVRRGPCIMTGVHGFAVTRS